MPFSAAHPTIAHALSEKGYETLTPVQAAVLEAEALNRDLLVSAQTGSGKTVAYGIALASTLLGEAERLPRAAEPLALVVAPTRELALQVERELRWLYAGASAVITSCVGGTDARAEQRALRQGCHIVVGTPGRLRDHLERGSLDTSAMRAVVLDEADEMLDLGFRDDLEEILDATPAERRTLLFSATLPKPIVALAKRYQKNAHRIATANVGERHADIEYHAIRVAPNDLEHAVVNVLRYFEARASLVFCATRDAVRHLHGNLVERGFAAVSLSGEMSQPERTRALQALRDGRARVCVATDVAARGIDLAHLDLVIHAELPHDAEILQHRSGRTGRAGRKGTCAILVPYPKRRRAEGLLRAANVDAKWTSPPTAEQIRDRDRERLLEDPLLIEAASEEDLAAGKALLEGRAPEEIAAAFLRLHRSRLPQPEELSDGGGAVDTAPRAAPHDGPRPGFEDTVWFRMNVGRRNNADPRWLLPYLCRRGHITKREVGAIRILDGETRFEIPRGVAARFADALKRTHTNGEDDGVMIIPGDAPNQGGGPGGRGGPRRPNSGPPPRRRG